MKFFWGTMLVSLALGGALVFAIEKFNAHKCEAVADQMQTDWHYSFATSCMVRWHGQMLAYSKIKVIQ